MWHRIAALLTFVVLLAAGPARAVELVSQPQVTVKGAVATVEWRTDVACGTRLSLGTQADKLDRKFEGPVTASHEVTLDALKPGVTYYYTVGSARQKLGSGTFTTPGSTAPSSPAQVAPKPPASSTNAARAPPPARLTWGRLDTLQDHFIRHGPDFQSRSADEYAAQAWQFLQRARAEGLPMKWDDEDGTLRVFDPKTRAFAAYNRNGTTKTYFRPNNPEYWLRQPGRLVKSTELPFK